MMHWQYSELWDYELVPGLSIVFVALFFVPLVLVSLATALTVRTNIKAWESRLRGVWSAASALAGFLIIMGHAFNYKSANPLYVIPVWVFSGYILIALPLRAKAMLLGTQDSHDTSPGAGDAV